MDWIPAKTILSKNKSLAWFAMDYTCNLYKGCCHGCIYCDSRSDCYRIQDFDKVRGKAKGIEILEKELLSKKTHGVVGMGSMSDPYNPLEQDYCLTKQALEQFSRHGYGVAIATKSNLVTRDIPLLKEISIHSPVIVKISITTAQDTLARKIEPHVAVSSQRFAAIEALAKQHIFAGVLFAPILPFLEDTENNIRNMVYLAKQSGARFIYPTWGVTLRQNQREYFFQQLDRNFPGVKQQYAARYGNAYECHVPHVKELRQAFQHECEKYGLLYHMKDIINAYRQPYETTQLSLF